MSTCITAHRMLDCLISSEVDRMCRTCGSPMSAPSLEVLQLQHHKPAPSTTLDTPLHNVRKPSTLDMVSIALLMPEYTAVGDGLTICIRVCMKHQQLIQPHQHPLNRTFIKSIGYMTVCSCISPLDRCYSHCPCVPARRTAMPAKAPAAMFAVSEKFGGSPS